jgi:hypothetical protein
VSKGTTDPISMCPNSPANAAASIAMDRKTLPTHRFATNLQHRRSSCQPSPRGRLRYVDRLRRPRWRHHQLSINIRPGPLNEGCSKLNEVQFRKLAGPVAGVRHHAAVSLAAKARSARDKHAVGFSLPHHFLAVGIERVINDPLGSV